MSSFHKLSSDLPTVILVCMLSLSTNTLLRMTASRATKMYVRLMSNTIDVPETHRREEWPLRRKRRCSSLQVLVFWFIEARANFYPQTCDAGSLHQWWSCCREAGNQLLPTASQSRCRGNGHQESVLRSLRRRRESGGLGRITADQRGCDFKTSKSGLTSTLWIFKDWPEESLVVLQFSVMSWTSCSWFSVMVFMSLCS